MNTTTLLNTDSQLMVLLHNFEVGSPLLKPDHLAYLQNVVKPRLGIYLQGTVIGMTSRTGPDALNANLSRARAEAVFKQIRGFTTDMPFDALKIGVGEDAAKLAGLKDGNEDGRWRAVLLVLNDPSKEKRVQLPGRYYERAWIYDASVSVFQDMVNGNQNPNTYIIPIRSTSQRRSANMVLQEWLDILVKEGTRFGNLVFITHGDPGLIYLDGDELGINQLSWYYTGRRYEKLLAKYGHVYFAGCNCAQDEKGWKFLEAAGKVFLSGNGGAAYGWTSIGFAVPSWFRPGTGHAVHLWGDVRYVLVEPGGNVKERVTK